VQLKVVSSFFFAAAHVCLVRLSVAVAGRHHTSIDCPNDNADIRTYIQRERQLGVSMVRCNNVHCNVRRTGCVQRRAAG
jgi:hypothetical protein